MSVQILFGPLVGRHADHNGIRYLLGSFVFPFLSAIYYTLVPFHPYRGLPFVRPGTSDIDTSDPDAVRLVEVYKSPEARRFVWRATVKISVVMFVSMVLLTLLVRNSLSWTLTSAGLGQSAIGCTVMCYLAVSVEYIEWGFRTWPKYGKPAKM